MTTNHTPGPWFLRNGGAGSVGTEEQMVACCYGDDPECRVDERMQANARLIAAAPEMFDALIKAEKVLLELEHMTGGGDDEINIESEILTVRAAIAKAKGEQQ